MDKAARGSAKVQIGAELLCKSANVRGKTFQVSGLGRREPGSGVRVRVQVQDLNFPAPVPVPDNPHLRPEGRDLGPENVSPMSTCQRINERCINSKGNRRPDDWLID
jgi:hypothetical protein